MCGEDLDEEGEAVMTDPFDPLRGAHDDADNLLGTLFRGFREPKDEHKISNWKNRLANRIKVNEYIIRHLRKKP